MTDLAEKMVDRENKMTDLAENTGDREVDSSP